MDEKKMAQDKWIGVVVWGVLAVGLLFTSNAMIDIFNSLISAVFSRINAGVASLFSDLPSLFVLLLALILLLALLNAWRNLVSLTFELVLAFSGKADGDLFEGLLNFSSDEEDAYPKSSLPSSVLRDLAIVWGLFYLIFLVLPLVF